MRYILITYSSIQNEIYYKKFSEYEQLMEYIKSKGFNENNLKKLDSSGHLWCIQEE